MVELEEGEAASPVVVEEVVLDVEHGRGLVHPSGTRPSTSCLLSLLLVFFEVLSMLCVLP